MLQFFFLFEQFTKMMGTLKILFRWPFSV